MTQATADTLYGYRITQPGRAQWDIRVAEHVTIVHVDHSTATITAYCTDPGRWCCYTRR